MNVLWCSWCDSYKPKHDTTKKTSNDFFLIRRNKKLLKQMSERQEHCKQIWPFAFTLANFKKHFFVYLLFVAPVDWCIVASLLCFGNKATHPKWERVIKTTKPVEVRVNCCFEAQPSCPFAPLESYAASRNLFRRSLNLNDIWARNLWSIL